MSTRRSHADYVEMLRLQLLNLRTCCDLFDIGRHEQAMQMAGILRTLLHSKGRVVSLIRHLGVERTIQFLSIAGIGHTVAAIEAQRQAGVLTMSLGLKMGAKRPEVIMTIQGDLAPFASWWEEEAVYSDERVVLSRRDVILLLAEKDGGSHVDADYPLALAQMRQGVGTYVATTKDGQRFETPLINQHWRISRQVAEEVLTGPWKV